MTIKLTLIESKIYELIKDEKELDFNKLYSLIKKKLIKNNNKEQLENLKDNIRRSIEILKYNSLILEENIINKEYILEKNALNALENGFIEEIFCNYIKHKNIKISNLKDLDIPNLDKNSISLAFGLLKKQDLIYLDNGTIKLKDDYLKKIEENRTILQKIQNNNLTKISKHILENLLKRKDFISVKDKVIKKYKINKIVNYENKEPKTLYLTSDLLKEDISKIDLKEFDVEKLPKPKTIGRVHPLRQVIYYMRDVFIQMGFKEMKGPYIETCFWNMDSMFISQDHPARDQQDTFYLPISGDLPKDETLIKTIQKLHKDGFFTKSKGYQYDWSKELAKKLVLRTHTTATTYRTFYKLKNKNNQKYFCIDKVFRNETIDSSHLPEFHQAEGFVIGDDLSLSNLLGFIKTFLNKLGINKIKFKPTYNPYTEPSVEALAYFEKQKEWIEVINAGIFRPESLAPYNIKNNVIAWGFGVERIAMLIYNKTIKEIFGDECDLDWLRNYTIPPRKL
jgi:phenylalanyl-tRNA synthetase alpha chain